MIDRIIDGTLAALQGLGDLRRAHLRDRAAYWFARSVWNQKRGHTRRALRQRARGDRLLDEAQALERGH